MCYTLAYLSKEASRTDFKVISNLTFHHNMQFPVQKRSCLTFEISSNQGQIFVQPSVSAVHLQLPTAFTNDCVKKHLDSATTNPFATRGSLCDTVRHHGIDFSLFRSWVFNSSMCVSRICCFIIKLTVLKSYCLCRATFAPENLLLHRFNSLFACQSNKYLTTVFFI